MNIKALLFIVGAMLSWGVYVPVVHEGGSRLGSKSEGSLRAFFCVGLAYFVVAIVVPLILHFRGIIKLDLTRPSGVAYASLAGVAGAMGALCVIFALRNQGSPLLVAPLVFAGAPIVNALFSTWWHPTSQRPPAPYFVGMVLAAAGAFLVLRYVPRESPSHGKAAAVTQAASETSPGPQIP